MITIDDPFNDKVDDLWRAHAAELVRFATVLVGPSDAYDIVADAFLRAVRQVDSREIENARAYLFRAVTNHAHDLRRSRDRRWARDLAAIGPLTSDAPDTFVDVRRAVAALSVAQRAVVYFVYWEDLSERSIAELLAVSPGTVRRHITRAQAHLRKALQ